jgi:hypothetical protein
MIREVGLFAGSAMRESGRANKVARRAWIMIGAMGADMGEAGRSFH